MRDCYLTAGRRILAYVRLVQSRKYRHWSETMTASESALTQTPENVQVPMYQRLFATAGNLYCHLFHNSISRPVGGKYRCWKCLREFELRW